MSECRQIISQEISERRRLVRSRESDRLHWRAENLKKEYLFASIKSKIFDLNGPDSVYLRQIAEYLSEGDHQCPQKFIDEGFKTILEIVKESDFTDDERDFVYARISRSADEQLEQMKYICSISSVGKLGSCEFEAFEQRRNDYRY